CFRHYPDPRMHPDLEPPDEETTGRQEVMVMGFGLLKIDFLEQPRQGQKLGRAQKPKPRKY
ncbi:MAG: hypothetical protein IKO09_01820, partial [Bacteroidales bacterium]|nr:hypothetical protein [Bacteroidales bacterium]